MQEPAPGLEDLVEALLVPDAYPDSVDEVQVLQTHISVLFFAGDRVYKLKKPVKLDFLDYTELEERRRFCEEEVRLNRRISPSMYLGVRPVTREESGEITLDGDGEEVDWVVEMVRLPEDRMLNTLLDRDELDDEQLESVALVLAKFHDRAMTGPSVNRHGLAPSVARMVEENIDQLTTVAREHAHVLPESVLQFLRASTARFPRENRALLEQRVAQWKIREGHGDLHAGNVCLVGDEVYVYDCVEFDRAFRCGDVAADLAFLAMDLEHRGHGTAAERLVGTYARATSDADLRRLLPFYKTHRALVRMKVDLTTAEDEAIEERRRRELVREAWRYGHLAVGYQLPPCLVLTCGLPAAGKSVAAQYFAGRLGAMLLRTDVLRKVDAPAASGSGGYGEGNYTEGARERVYGDMLDRAVECLEDGRSAVADATFSRARFRKPFFEAAARLGIPCYLVVVEVSDDVARERLEERATNPDEPSDADFAVYREEKKSFEPPDEVPGESLLRVPGTDPAEANGQSLLERMIAQEMSRGSARTAPRDPNG